jgi:exodeoxyribonuclease VII large subunit
VFDTKTTAAAQPRVWPVGALVRAIADTLQARFNPVTVTGEIASFSRATSGHCYFSLKDQDGQAEGQIRCAMFRRAASLLNFSPRDGTVVELRGRLDVYGPRGDLQLIVESMSQAGQGALFEQFLRIKAKLEAEGLFAAERKRPLPRMPRAIGLVTSLGAAALHDVATALKRRVPHIPVVLVNASVQGANAPAELTRALLNLYQTIEKTRGQSSLLSPNVPNVDVILLVRGGGSMDDLWAFNDESLARTIAASPVPVVSGVGHETDFTIADFVADLRAPTPTAAAELVAEPQAVWRAVLDAIEARVHSSVLSQLDTHGQRLDNAARRISRPSLLATGQGLRLTHLKDRLNRAALHYLKQENEQIRGQSMLLPTFFKQTLAQRQERLVRASLRLGGVDPALVLQRGYAWLCDARGQPITSVAQARPGQPVQATLADGTLDLAVREGGVHPT